MSCNPAIGGVAKGTVVREVDAMGGIMARATDLAMIQFRMLNRGKGAAVWAPRAQCDRGLYRRAVRSLLEEHSRLSTIQGTVARLLWTRDEVAGVETIEGRRFGARSVVLTTGTFLRGRIHIGTRTRIAGGRAGEASTVDLAEQLEQAGLEMARFKTGTPPRIDGRTVNFERFQRQDSEVEEFDYSWSHFWADKRASQDLASPRPAPCWITFSENGKRIIHEQLTESAMYGRAISARGPRAVLRSKTRSSVSDAERHQLFLEPEGHDTTELYVNGLSTSLPAPVQLEILRSIDGLSDVQMTRAGYAIEYDYFPPTQLWPSLESRAIPGLFFAGQVNGTTGYEEAAGQGLIAGLNAARRAQDAEPVILGRETSYIGVLIDDLTTRGVDEPYRLFTSRSEFRLTVRQDNALRRLAPIAATLGMFNAREQVRIDLRFEQESDASSVESKRRSRPTTRIQFSRWRKRACSTARPHRRAGAPPWRQPPKAVEAADAHGALDSDALTTVELELKYVSYFDRESACGKAASNVPPRAAR
jgi:tRNA uridine 5-carboxymethylaminomethyl modification enzyme